MKILEAVFSLDEAAGGSVLYARALGRALEALGHEVRSLTAGDWPRWWPLGEMWEPRAAGASARALDAWRPDVLHVHTPQRLTGAVVSAAVRRGIPVVATLHEGWWLCHETFLLHARTRRPCPGPGPLRCLFCAEGGPRWPLRVARNGLDGMIRRGWLWRVARKVRLWIAPTEYLRDVYVAAGWPADRVRVISPPVEISPSPPPHTPTLSPSGGEGDRVRGGEGDGTLRIGFFGGTRWKKGFRVLVEAAARASEERPVALVVWGPADSGEAAAAEDVAAGSGRRLALEFRGVIPHADVPSAMAGVDVVAAPSLMPESFSRIVAEAVAAGRPVVASDCGGAPEAARGAARLVPLGDVEALARALRKAAGGAPVPPVRYPTYAEHAQAVEAVFREAVEGASQTP